MELNLYPANGKDAQDVSIDNPSSYNSNKPLIPLRLPASILSTLSNESRLVINDSDANGEDGVAKLTVTQPKCNDRAEQGDISYQLEVADNQKQYTNWYQSTDTASSAAGVTLNKNKLQHIGNSNKQYKIKVSKADIKEIGKRTRKLLEEERKKRKEIVRLDDNDNECLLLPPLPEKKNMSVQKVPPDTKHKKISNKPINVRKRKRHVVAPNIDGWMPNVDELLLSNNTVLLKSTNEDEQSNIIRLHGLPIGVKPDHILQFFQGLNPSLIFVLPSFDMHIQGWDATNNNEDDEGCREKILIKRHAYNFRVYVKFTSTHVANAAMERMGESIGLDSVQNCRDGEIVGVSIAMSPVPKHIATYIEKHMVSGRTQCFC